MALYQPYKGIDWTNQIINPNTKASTHQTFGPCNGDQAKVKTKILAGKNTRKWRAPLFLTLILTIIPTV